jgi:regulatory protein
VREGDGLGLADERDQHALGLAYRYLNGRDRTVAEVREHLARRCVEPDVIEAAVQTLVDQGYLDDARFARLFAQDKRELEQWGSERIRRTLLARAVDRELVDDAVNCQATESELDRALALMRRRLASPPRSRHDRDRALGILIRKGYDPDLALEALAALGADEALAALSTDEAALGADEVALGADEVALPTDEVTLPTEADAPPPT